MWTAYLTGVHTLIFILGVKNMTHRNSKLLFHNRRLLFGEHFKMKDVFRNFVHVTSGHRKHPPPILKVLHGFCLITATKT